MAFKNIVVLFEFASTASHPTLLLDGVKFSCNANEFLFNFAYKLRINTYHSILPRMV